jgi:hypothetical protein
LSQRDTCHQRAASVPLAPDGQVPENRQQDAGGTELSQRDNCYLSSYGVEMHSCAGGTF